MATRPLPCPTVLRQLLRCEPETGRLFWKRRSKIWFSKEADCAAWNGRMAGKQAFITNNIDGYFTGRIFGKAYFAHRILWAMVHGNSPVNYIDHINGCKSDNRIENLRDVPHAINMRNTIMQKNNTSGHTGVGWKPKQQRWQAHIKIDGKMRHLGFFSNLEAAVEARKAAEVRLGFHANHGRTD